jgi:hypothetical protein
MTKPFRILSEQQVADLNAARDHLMSVKLDRSRRVLPLAATEAALADINRILANHQAAPAYVAGVQAHG